MTTQRRDWNQRYIDGDTPWTTEQPTAELFDLLGQFSLTAQSVAGGRVLDLGCGVGTNAIHLARRGFSVTAVDVAATAIDWARKRAETASVDVDFRVADLLDPAAVDALDPFELIVDRGTYHCLRTVDLDAFLATLERLTRPGTLYIALTGNANDPGERPVGPPTVHAHELIHELAPMFELVQLREFMWDDIELEGSPHPPWGWSAVHRRKAGVPD